MNASSFIAVGLESLKEGAWRKWFHERGFLIRGRCVVSAAVWFACALGRLQFRGCCVTNSAMSDQNGDTVTCQNNGHRSEGGDESRCGFFALRATDV